MDNGAPLPSCSNPYLLLFTIPSPFFRHFPLSFATLFITFSPNSSDPSPSIPLNIWFLINAFVLSPNSYISPDKIYWVCTRSWAVLVGRRPIVHRLHSQSWLVHQGIPASWLVQSNPVSELVGGYPVSWLVKHDPGSWLVPGVGSADHWAGYPVWRHHVAVYAPVTWCKHVFRIYQWK